MENIVGGELRIFQITIVHGGFNVTTDGSFMRSAPILSMENDQIAFF